MACCDSGSYQGYISWMGTCQAGPIATATIFASPASRASLCVRLMVMRSGFKNAAMALAGQTQENMYKRYRKSTSSMSISSDVTVTVDVTATRVINVKFIIRPCASISAAPFTLIGTKDSAVSSHDRKHGFGWSAVAFNSVLLGNRELIPDCFLSVTPALDAGSSQSSICRHGTVSLFFLDSEAN